MYERTVRRHIILGANCQILRPTKCVKMPSLLMRITTTVFLLLAVAAVADEREPKGSTTSWSVTTNNSNIVFHFHNSTSGSNWIVNGGPPPIALPHTYKDADSGILFYVESDGQHVTAIKPDGKILWSREPFGDAHLDFYRTKTPRIVYIERIDEAHNWMLKGKSGKYIGIRFNSSQSGILDVKTGDFTFMGQN